MKRMYSLYAAAFSLVFAGAVFLLTPPRTVLRVHWQRSMSYGENVSIPVAPVACSCVDNEGCSLDHQWSQL
jgi:hypothetical protein